MITTEQIARLTGLTPEAIEEDKKKRQLKRAKAIAQFAIHSIIDDEMRDVAKAALYHANKLMIGCEPKPPIIYGNAGIDTEIWGMKVSASNAQANRAFSIGD